MNLTFAVLFLGLAASAYCWPFSGVISGIKEHWAQDISLWKSQVEEDANLIQDYMKENLRSILNGDPKEAIKTITKNYIKLAKIIVSHAMNNSYKIAHDLKEDVEKIIAEYNAASTKAEPETEAPIKPETEGSAESKTEDSDEPETETKDGPESETSDEPETETSDEPETETKDEPESETSDEPDTETSNGPETKTSDEPETETSDEPETKTSDEPETQTSDESNSETSGKTETEIHDEPEIVTSDEPETNIPENL